jgi:hypothetical protein
MNKYITVIAPMRAQPFHFGHQRYVSQLSYRFHKVLILLNRDNSFDDPFSFEIRKKWILNYCLSRGLSNVSVPERLECEQKHEYRLLGGEDFLIITTNETNGHYADLGFCTLNHQNNPLPNPPKAEKFPDWCYSRTCDTGQIIRAKMRAGDSCKGLVSEEIELEALALIG